ncbi:APC family permease [Dasania marina]|uniref:APC family permease n=1 Tax=Dasania marina TaxID=471499 RepID=UPI000371CC9F|nr:amino acid permease [Dasania marina]
MSETQQGNLERVLSQKEVLALAFGAMVGWSWVALAGSWVLAAGTGGAIAAFVLGGGLMVLIGLTYAELAAAMPFVGGEHVYSHRALGGTAAFVCTWAIILAYVSVAAFEAVALPTVMEEVIPGLKTIELWTVAGYQVYLSWALIGMVAAVFVTWINVRGVKAAALLQTVVTVLLLVAGVMFVTGASFNGSADNMPVLFKDGISGFVLVLVAVPFMFVGFDVIPQMAEEINLPHKKIGQLIIVSVLMAVLWYSLISFGVGMSLSPAELNSSRLATADAAGSVWGSGFARDMVILAGIAGIITSWNAFFIGGARAIYVMAKAGQLPAALGKLHPKYNTPHNAIILIGVLCVIAPLFGRKMLVWLVDAGSFSVVIAYGLVALSFVVLRIREPEMPRPYKVVGGVSVGILAFVASLGLGTLYLPGSVAALVWPEWMIVLGWAVLGALCFLLRNIHRRGAHA